jgi:hypothetical protein
VKDKLAIQIRGKLMDQPKGANQIYDTLLKVVRNIAKSLKLFTGCFEMIN